MARLPFLTTLPPLERETTAWPLLQWCGPFCSAGACSITMPLAMHCNKLCGHSAYCAEHALVTVPGVIIVMALLLLLLLAGADVPPALLVWALGMQGCWVWLFTVSDVTVALYVVVLVIYVSRHIYANFLAALARLIGPGPAQHKYSPGGIFPSTFILYVASLPYPVSLMTVLALHCQRYSGQRTCLHCCLWLPHCPPLLAAPICKVLL
jgi:hypothetical protein